MKKSILILVVAVTVVMAYQFIIRPIQIDKKLKECLNIPTLNGIGTQEEIKNFEDYCFKQYGN